MRGTLLLNIACEVSLGAGSRVIPAGGFYNCGFGQFLLTSFIRLAMIRFRRSARNTGLPVGFVCPSADRPSGLPSVGSADLMRRSSLLLKDETRRQSCSERRQLPSYARLGRARAPVPTGAARLYTSGPSFLLQNPILCWRKAPVFSRNGYFANQKNLYKSFIDKE
jgi:hypothetical protein